MKYNDKISVVIPTYNRAQTIIKSINSVLAQTYDNLELIIVDDGSTDNTEELIKQLNDKRIKYIKLPKNRGACVARNKGIDESTGKYIAFQDSDDIFYKDKLEKQYNNLIRNKSDMDFCKINVISNDNEVVIPNINQEKNIMKGNYIDELIKGNFISTQAILIKRDVVNKYMFDINLPRLQDFDLVVRMISNIKVSYTNEILVDLSTSGERISTSNEKLLLALRIMNNKNYNLKYPYNEKFKEYIMDFYSANAINNELKKCQLFYSESDEFSEDKSVRIVAKIISQSGKLCSFEAKFEIPENCNQIRFDICETQLVKIKNIKFNGKNVNETIFNTIDNNEDNISLNNDPFIIIKKKLKKGEIVIFNYELSFATFDIIYESLIDKMNNKLNELNVNNKKMEQDYKEISEKYKKMQINYNILTRKNEKKERIYSSIIYSRSWKLTKPVRVLKKIKREFLNLKIKNDNKQSILFFIHSWINLSDYNSTSIGGTTIYLLDIINYIKNNIHCYVITIINDEYVLISFENGIQKIYGLGIYVKTRNFDEYDSEFYLKTMEIIKNLQIDLININHIINFPCDLGLIAKKIKTIFTFHDYTTICLRNFLIDNKNNTCNDRNIDKCLQCIGNYNKEKYMLRAKAISSLINNCYSLIAPDESIINEISSYFKLSNINIIPHGINKQEFVKFDLYNHNFNNKKINVAFVGSIDGHKGGKVVYDLIENKKPNIIYHLFGMTNEQKYRKNYDNYIYHGEYNKAYLPKLLNDNKIDLVIFLNKCKETFSYTLSEVLYSKIPCLSYDIGAIGNRIEKNDLGWVIPVTYDYRKIEEKFDTIFEKNEYLSILKNVQNYEVTDNNYSIDTTLPIYAKDYVPRIKYNYNHVKYLENYELIFTKK